MHVLTELNRGYLSRFANLDDGTQVQIIETIDAGGQVLSTYDLATGRTVCNLAPVESAGIAIWEYTLAESEAAALGDAVEDSLNLLPLDYKHAVNEKLADGWRLQAVVRHDGPGVMLVCLARNGDTIELARLKNDPTLH